MTTAGDTRQNQGAGDGADAQVDAQVDALNAQSWMLAATDPEGALAVCTQARARLDGREYPAGLARCLRIAAQIHNRRDECETARALASEGARAGRDAGDAQTEAECLEILGVAHRLLSDLPAALQSHLQALALWDALPEEDVLEGLMGASGPLSITRLTTLRNLAATYQELGDSDTSLTYLREALMLSEWTGAKPQLSRTLSSIAVIHGQMRHFAAAAEHSERGLHLADECGDYSGQMSNLCNLAAALKEMNRYAEARVYAERLRGLTRSAGDRNGEIYSLRLLAEIEEAGACPAEAASLYDEALRLAREIKNRTQECLVLLPLGLSALARGDLEAAGPALTLSCGMAEEMNLAGALPEMHGALSELCERRGDFRGALAHQKALAALQKKTHDGQTERRTRALMVQMDVEKTRREAELHRQEAEIHRLRTTELADANDALQEANIRLEDANARLHALATTDPLTGLLNHRAMVAAIDGELERAHRHGRPCALLFLDIDHFKALNDGRGHLAGDQALREFARVVRGSLRGPDILGRWGGEEFVALLPETDMGEALRVGERARAAVAGAAFTPQAVRLTCSVGVSASPASADGRDALVHAADEAMYAAKRLGRDQTRRADDPAVAALAHARGQHADTRAEIEALRRLLDPQAFAPPEPLAQAV